MKFRYKEAANYVLSFKSSQNRLPDSIKEKTSSDYHSKLIDTLKSIRGINKPDVLTLSTNFNSLYDMIHHNGKERREDDEEEDEDDGNIDKLLELPGFGDAKAKRFHKVFRQPFIINKKKSK